MDLRQVSTRRQQLTRSGLPRSSIIRAPISSSLSGTGWSLYLAHQGKDVNSKRLTDSRSPSPPFYHLIRIPASLPRRHSYTYSVLRQKVSYVCDRTKRQKKRQVERWNSEKFS